MSEAKLADVDVWGSHGVAVDAVTVEMMKERNKLMSVEQAVTLLQVTEPLGQIDLQIGDQPVVFNIDDSWNHGTGALGGEEPVNAEVSIGGSTYRLTKDAVLEAGSKVGLTRAYTEKAPAKLTQDALNYWYKTGFGRSMKLLTVGDIGHAVASERINPFSNVRFIEEAVQSIEARHPGVEVLVDAKMGHSLRRTNVRLVVPDICRNIPSQRHGANHPDTWSGGIALQNSLIGEGTTELSSYLFAWLCTNGAITTQGDNRWNRKRGGQGDEVYEWMKNAVDEAVGHLDHEFDKIEALTRVNLDGTAEEVSQALTDIFSDYGVPIKARERIIANMVNSDDQSMYGIMQAITMAANTGGDQSQIDALLRIGGNIATTEHNRCGECHRVTV